MTNLSFTHSRLLKVKAGSSVVPGHVPLEGDLAESWSRLNDTTYVFRLRKGVRWHNKPPVNGRELTADDVKYTYERFAGVKGNPNRSLLEHVQRIEVVDRHTVKITLRERFAWFLDYLATTVMWIVAREAVEHFGDLKRAEACIGTGPWMLERYEPGARLTFVRHPHYFVPRLPYVDAVQVTIDNEASSRFAGWLAGHYDFAPEYGMCVRRVDLDVARQKKAGLQTREFVALFGGMTMMKLDREPFNDVRVRRTLALASDWKEVLEGNAWSLGHGVPNPAVPAALKEWSIPIGQLSPLGRSLYESNVAAARALLAEARQRTLPKIPLDATGAWSSDYLDALQVDMKNWRAAGIDTELKLKEFGAFMSSALLGRFDRLAHRLRGASTVPDAYLHPPHIPGHPLNAGGVDDPKLTTMIQAQRQTFDGGKRRDIVHDIQRHLAEQVYYQYGPSVSAVAAWEPYVKNFAPNIGHDYGGRLMVAWLDK